MKNNKTVSLHILNLNLNTFTFFFYSRNVFSVEFLGLKPAAHVQYSICVYMTVYFLTVTSISVFVHMHHRVIQLVPRGSYIYVYYIYFNRCDVSRSSAWRLVLPW